LFNLIVRKQMKGFFKRELPYAILGCILIGIFVPLFVHNKNPFTTPLLFFQSFGMTLAYCCSIWLLCSSSIKKIWNYYPIPGKVIQNVVSQVIGITLIVSIIVFVVGLLDAYLFGESLAELYRKNFNVSLAISAFVCAIYNAIHLFNLLKKSIAEKEQLEKANVQSQLEILKNQIKPHFLFNSLNTLATLIPEDTEQSVKYVESLAKVYRDCIEAYLFMLQIRFGDNLKVSINEDGLENKHHIVPLSLQLLIENAMKHNIISNKKPLFIDIERGKNSNLIISNNLQKKEQMMPSTGIGLDNINKRYQMISQKQIDVIVTDNKFSVSIPLISVV